MISLLLAYFGKGKIPDSVRYVLLAIGLSILAYRLNRIRKAHRAYREAMAIKQVMDKKIADQKMAEQQATIAQQQATIKKQQQVLAEQATPTAITSSDQTPSPQPEPASNVGVSPQTLAGFFLS